MATAESVRQRVRALRRGEGAVGAAAPDRSRAAAFALLLLAPALAQDPTEASDPVVTWRGESQTATAIEGTAPNAAACVRSWFPLAQPRGYRLILSDDARVLLVLGPHYARKQRKVEHPEVATMLQLMRDTTSAVAELLGLADTTAPTAVITAIRQQDYADLLRHIAALDPRLTQWAANAGQAATGYVLSQPLAAAWIEDAAGQEEWNHDNELVHRTAQLLIRQRTDQLPPWFVLGLAWHIEDTVRHSIYCYPHRAGFVWAHEHTGWGLALATRFKKASGSAAPVHLTIEDFAPWKPGERDAQFEVDRAHLAFGVARFLAYEHAAALPELATALDAEIEGHWKVWLSDHEWRTDPDYQIPPARQLEILRTIDAELLEHATAFFQKKGAERRPASRKR